MNPLRPLAPIPAEINLNKRRRTLTIAFPDGVRACLSAEYLRVHSPSAERTGHTGGEGLLITGKEDVSIEAIEPVGRYAVRLTFDDGHDSGLYSWAVLYDLARNHDQKWQRYIERLEQAGHQREGGGSRGGE